MYDYRRVTIKANAVKHGAIHNQTMCPLCSSAPIKLTRHIDDIHRFGIQETHWYLGQTDFRNEKLQKAPDVRMLCQYI